jgi:hypothetical protein
LRFWAPHGPAEEPIKPLLEHRSICYRDRGHFDDSFDFLVDSRLRLIGLEVEPQDGTSFVLPMSYETAEQVGMNLLKMLLFHAPEMAQARLAGAA